MVEKWLEDFNLSLKKIEPDFDKRQQIIRLFKILLKEMQKKWKEKLMHSNSPKLFNEETNGSNS